MKKLDLMMVLVNTFIFTWGWGNQTIIEERNRQGLEQSVLCNSALPAGADCKLDPFAVTLD